MGNTPELSDRLRSHILLFRHGSAIVVICKGCKLCLTDFEHYLPLVGRDNRDKAHRYFLRDQVGLEVSDSAIRAYAQKHNKQQILSQILPDQMSIVFYCIRLARIVEIGATIDNLAVNVVTDVAMDRLTAFQNEIRALLG